MCINHIVQETYKRNHRHFLYATYDEQKSQTFFYEAYLSTEITENDYVTYRQKSMKNAKHVIKNHRKMLHNHTIFYAKNQQKSDRRQRLAGKSENDSHAD